MIRKMIEKRGKYNVEVYEVDIDENMRMKALRFAKAIILSDNQFLDCYLKMLEIHMMSICSKR